MNRKREMMKNRGGDIKVEIVGVPESMIQDDKNDE